MPHPCLPCSQACLTAQSRLVGQGREPGGACEVGGRLDGKKGELRNALGDDLVPRSRGVFDGRLFAAACLVPATLCRTSEPLMPVACVLQELAWASYALLRNTNICGLAACWEGRPVLARGLLALPGGAPPGGKGDAAAAAVLEALSGDAWQAATAVAASGQLYCPDRAAIEKAGAAAWPGVPLGAESLLAQPLLPLDAASSTAAGSPSGIAAPGSVLLLLSERPRALSSKERAWAAAIAAKLHAALGQAP